MKLVDEENTEKYNENLTKVRSQTYFVPQIYFLQDGYTKEQLVQQLRNQFGEDKDKDDIYSNMDKLKIGSKFSIYVFKEKRSYESIDGDDYRTNVLYHILSAVTVLFYKTKLIPKNISI